MGERHLKKTDGLVNSGDHGMSIASELAEREGLVFGGRYRAIKELGAGVGKRTLLAIDRARGETVVLKARDVRFFSRTNCRRFESECRRFCELRGLTPRPALDVGRDGDLLFAVMPFHPGTSLKAAPAAAPPQPDGNTAGGNLSLYHLARTARAAGAAPQRQAVEHHRAGARPDQTRYAHRRRHGARRLARGRRTTIARIRALPVAGTDRQRRCQRGRIVRSLFRGRPALRKLVGTSAFSRQNRRRDPV